MVKAKRLGFRAWFYLRMGYSIYWAFLFMGINTLTVTYFLAIDNVPFLKDIFPTFTIYVIFLVVVGIPILITTGYVHYKRIPGYKSEVEVTVESNPYQFKLPPGFWLHVIMPYFRLESDLLMKIIQNQKINDDEVKKMQELQSKMDHLLKGGYVGDKNIVKRFESHD